MSIKIELNIFFGMTFPDKSVEQLDFISTLAPQARVDLSATISNAPKKICRATYQSLQPSNIYAQYFLCAANYTTRCQQI